MGKQQPRGLAASTCLTLTPRPFLRPLRLCARIRVMNAQAHVRTNDVEPARPHRPEVRELIDGATAIVRGALAAGCDFFAGYPITPATPIVLAMMREMPKIERTHGIRGIAVQGEDEISSIGMCLGAAATGRRALTATSGPGMSLYSENIGLAIMTELPLVIVDVQRLGPSTGGATSIGQGDVQFVRWGTGGGYPLIVLAPSTVSECAALTVEAFRLAAQFRAPVVVLTDKGLNLTRATVDLLEFAAREAQGAPAPLRAPGQLGSGQVVRFTGSTHDERQMMTKDPIKIEALNRRLLTKYDAHRQELERVALDLDVGCCAGSGTLLVGYGTAAGAVRAAVQLARGQGRCVSSAVVQSLWPVPEGRLRRAAGTAARIVVVELNPGLYAREVRCLFPNREVVSLSRVDGQLISPKEVVAACL